MQTFIKIIIFIKNWILELGNKLSALSRVWQKYDFFLDLIRCSRVTLFILVFAAVFLYLPNSQGEELTIRLNDNLTHTLVFLLGVFLWAFQAWIGTRKVMDTVNPRITVPIQSPSVWSQLKAFFKSKSAWARLMQNQAFWIEHWPRILGVLVFLISLAALWLPVHLDRISLFSPHGLIIVGEVGLAVLFYWLTMERRLWIQKKGNPKDHWAQLDNLYAFSSKFTTVYVLILLLLATFTPVWLGFTLGSAGIVVLGFSALTATGNFIIRRIVVQGGTVDYGTATQFPVLSVLFVVAVVFSFTNDNHYLRLLADKKMERPQLKEFAVQWAERNPLNAKSVRPMVFVAAAGGGIRASHWTSAVLTYLTDNNPKFAESVFAISGVSGGSVGAAFYNSMLKQNIKCENNTDKNCLQTHARKVLSHDFLGPVVSSLLFNDLLQRFFPVNFLPDRQKALESGWERAWSMTFDDSTGMAAPYSSTWSKNASKEKWLPLLLLNSTHMETGRKVITSPFELDSDAFSDDIDLIQLLGNRDMPVSVAAGNSARFTYVSPPGTLPYDGGLLNIREDNGHVLDGGYFDNNGAITLLGLLKALQSLKLDDGSSFFEHYAIKPIVVLITNDNQLVCDKNKQGLVKCPNNVWIKSASVTDDLMLTITDFNGTFTRLSDNNGANETLGPIMGILNVRDGHGIAGVKHMIGEVNECRRYPQVCHLSESTKPSFYHFRVDLNEGENPPALGWVLSKDSEELIWNKIKARNGKYGSQHNNNAAQGLLEQF